MNYYPVEGDINSTIASAGPADFIYLPEGTITTPIIINNACTIIGQQTSLDVRGLSINNAITITTDVDLSALEVLNDTGSNQVGLNITSPATLTNIVSTGNIGFKIESVDGIEMENCQAINSSTGYHIINSRNCIVDGCEASQCDLGFDLEGTSAIVGDAYGHQELGLSINSGDMSP